MISTDSKSTLALDRSGRKCVSCGTSKHVLVLV